MNRRFFVSNVILMISLNFLVKPAWVFLIDRKVQLQVGNEPYGLYAALLNLGIIFNILLDLGLTNYNSKTLAEDTSRFKNMFPNAVLAKMILSLLYFFVLILVALMFQYNALAIQTILWIGLIQFLNSLLLYLRSNFSAHHDFKYDSFLSILDKLLMIAICGYYLFGPLRESFTIYTFIYAQVISYSISIAVALILITKRYAAIGLQEISGKEIRSLLTKSFPYATLILLMGIYMRMDTVLLERILGNKGPGIAGDYMAAYRILDALNMFGFLFAGILLPMFSKRLAEGKKVNELVQSGTNLMIPFALVIVAFSFSYYHEIMHFLYLGSYHHAEVIYRIIVFCFPAYCLMYVYSTLLAANGDIKLLIGIVSVLCILSIGLNLVFIPEYEIFGIAYTSIFVHWMAAFLYIIFALQRVQLHVLYSRVLQFTFFFLLFLVTNAVFHFIHLNVWISLFVNVLITIPVIYIFRLWDLRLILRYFRQMGVRD